MNEPMFEPQIDAKVQGEPYALGVELGEQLSDRIQTSMNILSELDFFRVQQPWWMPYPAFLRYAEYRAQSMLEHHVGRDFPAVRERIMGMAAGAQVRRGSLYLFLALEAVMASLDSSVQQEVAGCPEPFAACTAVAVTGRRSASGEALVAHNFDNVRQSQGFFVVRETQRPGRLRSLEFTGAPMSGAVDGVNEAGLCITYDYAMTIDNEQAGSPVSLAIEEALGSCKTVNEAASLIKKRRRCGGALLMLADASGDIAALEVSSTRTHLRRPSGGENVLQHSNAFQSDSMKKVEVAPEACYADNTPTGLRGKRVLESPMKRDQRLRELLSPLKRIGPDDLTQAMSDHGAEQVGTSDTVCMHGDHWSTVACLQLFPAERSMRVAYGSACQAKFMELSL